MHSRQLSVVDDRRRGTQRKNVGLSSCRGKRKPKRGSVRSIVPDKCGTYIYIYIHVYENDISVK